MINREAKGESVTFLTRGTTTKPCDKALCPLAPGLLRSQCLHLHV